MENTVLTPRRGRGEKEIPSTGIILVNPTDATAIINAGAREGGHRRPLFNSNLLIIPATEGRKKIFIAGPAVGAPMAVMALEKLIALGAARIIVYGWAGALTGKLNCGEVVLPTWGLSTEGTSAHYPIKAELPRPSPGLLTNLHQALTKSETIAKIHQGPVWSTDAPYRETRRQVQEFAARGIMAVDMEFTALATVALFRGTTLAAAFLVSDNLGHKHYESRIMLKSFRQQSRKIAATIITALTAGEL